MRYIENNEQISYTLTITIGLLQDRAVKAVLSIAIIFQFFVIQSYCFILKCSCPAMHRQNSQWGKNQKLKGNTKSWIVSNKMKINWTKINRINLSKLTKNSTTKNLRIRAIYPISTALVSHYICTVGDLPSLSKNCLASDKSKIFCLLKLIFVKFSK